MIVTADPYLGRLGTYMRRSYGGRSFGPWMKLASIEYDASKTSFFWPGAVPVKRKQAALRHDPRERWECALWRYMDKLYQEMDQTARDKWRKALKKRHMSAYDLWMKESLEHGLHCVPPPDEPSNSGGFSKPPLNPGTTFPAFPELQFYPIQRFSITYDGPGDWGDVYLLKWNVWDPFEHKIPEYRLQVFFGREAEGAYYNYDDVINPDTVWRRVEIPPDARPQAEALISSLDDTWDLYFQAIILIPFLIWHQGKRIFVQRKFK